MSVYVDPMRARYGRMIMCHMIADTFDELHAMADRIGVARRHFQNQSVLPHYDVCLTKRRLAIKHGAIEIAREAFVTRIIAAKAHWGVPPHHDCPCSIREDARG